MCAHASRSTSRSRPCGSEPITIATGGSRTPWSNGSPPVTSVPTTVTPASRSASTASSSWPYWTIGTRNTEPAEARTAFGPHGSAPPTTTTASAATASAARTRVPRLPGSLTPARTSTTDGAAGKEAAGRATIASIGCGVVEGASRSNTWSRTSRNSALAGRRRSTATTTASSSACSGTITTDG